ncbi:hypothetical protein S40285_05596 [Stachybotrys chlorohalonatus IBT 40285]|uniref:glucan endo-1,3-beta-D-glucosidase n=1 Tax=Stachybotrys chlorohalonatus (strain IBT 40285) TaxID=1283841 RepID=A0A084QCW1_STAC4|nr:hypothetical protein S40285_05596 [Stachybotrys chlorohalonata IBT 40285]
MQYYSQDDPYEREPLDSYRSAHSSPGHAPPPPAHNYSQADHSRYYESAQQHHQGSFGGQYGDAEYSYDRGHLDYDNSRNNDPYYSTTRGADDPAYAVRGERAYGSSAVPNNVTPDTDNFNETASGGMAGIAYNVADQNARESGMEAMHSPSQVPPPPSRAHNPNAYKQPYPPIATGGYQYESGYGYGQSSLGPTSNTNLVAPGATASRSPSRSPNTHPNGDRFADDPYSGYLNLSRNAHTNLGVVDPNAIEDDGDDGLTYTKNSHRGSFPSAPNSDRGSKPAAGAAVTAVGAGAGAGGLFNRGNREYSADYDLGTGAEKPRGWGDMEAAKKRKRRRIIILVVLFVIIAAIIGGLVGGLLTTERPGGQSGGNDGQSAEDDHNENGDLDAQSEEIRELMGNSDLHRVFPGMDYTPLNTQYPDCVHNPPSQNNVTRDVAVLSQLTNKIRLYGTDCNQTEMVIHAIRQLDLEDEIKIWLGVWQDQNETTNERQLDQMWTILDEYGAEPFEGIIVANEILFREEMTLSELSDVLSSVRRELDEKSIDLPVATSDLGDDWRQALADSSDYIMANIHPFFAGVQASGAAAWTMNFWETHNGPYFKSNTSRNIISETGWPTGGGTHCGGPATCAAGSVAGVDELNQFMDDWVCQALANGTNYFWFEAFDEPWKIRFNEDGKEWEDKWGLMDVNRNLKDGVVIPDCGGRTVD